MHWKLWRALYRTLDAIGIVLAYPGLWLLDTADRCAVRMRAAKARGVKPFPPRPGFVKATRVE